MCYQSHQSSKLSELIELPEVFSSMKKCLFHGALRLGDPLIKLLELRFVSLSSETSRSFQTSQSSQSSITSHPAFPDALLVLFWVQCMTVVTGVGPVWLLGDHVDCKWDNSLLGVEQHQSLDMYKKNEAWCRW